jgi:hypothetical protein
MRAVVFALLVGMSAGQVSAQTVRLGTLEDSARSMLQASWTDSVHQVERGYCITQFWRTASRYKLVMSETDTEVVVDTVYRVERVVPAKETGATPATVDFTCPKGQPTLHVHTPTTCWSPNMCLAGGPNAYQCQPSRQDLILLIERGDSFAVIQCDRRAFRFYYPSDYVKSGG